MISDVFVHLDATTQFDYFLERATFQTRIAPSSQPIATSFSVGRHGAADRFQLPAAIILASNFFIDRNEAGLLVWEVGSTSSSFQIFTSRKLPLAKREPSGLNERTARERGGQPHSSRLDR